MKRQALTIIRFLALGLGLMILAAMWVYATIMIWGISSGAFFGYRSAPGPSLIFIVCAVLSYICVAALLFSATLRQK